MTPTQPFTNNDIYLNDDGCIVVESAFRKRVDSDDLRLMVSCVEDAIDGYSIDYELAYRYYQEALKMRERRAGGYDA